MLITDLLITSPALWIVKAITLLSNVTTFILHMMKPKPIFLLPLIIPSPLSHRLPAMESLIWSGFVVMASERRQIPQHWWECVRQIPQPRRHLKLNDMGILICHEWKWVTTHESKQVNYSQTSSSRARPSIPSVHAMNWALNSSKDNNQYLARQPTASIPPSPSSFPR
jgi:hypothetical protein